MDEHEYVGLMRPAGRRKDEDPWSSSLWVADEKPDGFCGRIEFDHTGQARMYKKGAEVTGGLPLLCRLVLAGWALHVEWCAGAPVFRRELVATMLSGGWERVENPSVAIVDVLWTASKDGADYPLSARLGWRKFAANVIKRSLWPLNAFIPRMASGDDSSGRFCGLAK